jgi:hypothetical protein
MGQINRGRLLLGGLVAGLVITFGEYLLNGVILANYYVEVTAGLGVPQMSNATIGVFVLLSFVIGLVSVWLYAAVRPRLGPGVGTALKIAAAVWFFAYVMQVAGYWGLGIMDSRIALGVIAWGLLEMTLGITAGAWVYREEA